MNQKTVSAIMLTLLLTSMLTLAFNIQRVKATPTTIYVDDDNTTGPWDGTPEHPYQNITSGLEHAMVGDVIFVRNGTYYEHPVLDKSLMLVGENMYTTIIDAGGSGDVLHVEANNITITGFTIQHAGGGPFNCGIEVLNSCNTSIHHNIITSNSYTGITVRTFYGDCYNNHIFGNNISNNYWGIDHMDCGTTNTNYVYENNISHNSLLGVRTYRSKTAILDNNITQNGEGVCIQDCLYCSVSGNNVINNYDGIQLDEARYCSVYHNNLIDNAGQALEKGWSNIGNVWDEGYPSGGNYWSDYIGEDCYQGSYQNQTGSDGIGDIPYIVPYPYIGNRDNYPLMKPYPWASHDIGITSVTTSKTIIGEGYDLLINTTVMNYGAYTETFNVTLYINETFVELQTVTLASRNSTTITSTWNTSGFAYGNYSMSAYATLVENETYTVDNTLVDGWLFVTIPGDVNGDKKVNILDCILIANHFGHVDGDGHTPGSKEWFDCVNCDINSDSRTNVLDCIILSNNFGQSWT